jgi:membrane protease YdiL (CAAX protease family)
MRDMTQKISQETLRLLSLTSGGDLVLQIVVVAMVPAICEELFFRGALQPVMQTLVRNEHVGVLLTAVIFSLLHGDIYGFIPRLVLGAFLGYLFWTTGSLVAGMCAHFANNLIVVVLNHLYNAGTISFNPFEPMGMPWVMTAGCTLGAILLFYIYFVKNLSNNNVQTPSES